MPNENQSERPDVSAKATPLTVLVFLLVFFPQAAWSQEGPVYFSVSAGIAEYVGDSSEFIDTGGTVILGLGREVSSNTALEGEVGGAWSAVDVFGFSGSAQAYSAMIGPRFFTTRSEYGELGTYIGGGIGYSYSEVDIARFFHLGQRIRMDTESRFRLRP